jgi:hypothetical protein
MFFFRSKLVKRRAALAPLGRATGFAICDLLVCLAVATAGVDNTMRARWQKLFSIPPMLDAPRYGLRSLFLGLSSGGI